MAVSVEKRGRRYYVLGDTYPIKDRLRAAGCRWDGEVRAWWTGKADVAESFRGAVPEPTDNDEDESSDDSGDTIVAGRVTYKGRTYYLAGKRVRGHGYRARDGVAPIETHDGDKFLLVFRDGSKTFWAAVEAVRIDKQYDRPQTIASLREFATRAKSGEARCQECGGFGELVHDLEDGALKHRHCCDIPPR